MSSKRFSLPSLYLVGILLSAGACNRFTGPPFADYEISGTVRVKGTGTPIAGATVNVFAPSGNLGPSTAVQFTGVDGKYDIKFNTRCPGGGTFYITAFKSPTYFGPNQSFDCKYGSAVFDFDLTAMP